MKFVDEGPKLRSRRRAGIQDQHASCIVFGKDARSSSAHVDDYTALRSLSSPKADSDQVAASFMASMFPLGAESVQKSLLGSFLWHIPPRLGLNASMDYAIHAVATSYFGRRFRDGTMLRRAEHSYGAALRSLAMMINNKDKQLESEVLCATILLGHYEVNLDGAQDFIGLRTF